MLARKPVLYTAWDPEESKVGPDLIPFADWDAAITVLRRPVTSRRRCDAVPAGRAGDGIRREVVADSSGQSTAMPPNGRSRSSSVS